LNPGKANLHDNSARPQQKTRHYCRDFLDASLA
jgi:hypothetical protein